MEVDQYQQYHQKRFDYLFRLVTELKPDPQSRILDVGPGPFTRRLLERYPEVWSLGFDQTAIFDADDKRSTGAARRHIVFDLCDSVDESRWVDLPELDLIVFSEVIEHVHAPPDRMLAFLASGLKPDGLLLCQTPNAVALHKRLAMLAGKAPYNRWGSGHITEFTKPELYRFGEMAGLEVARHEFKNYFGYDGSSLRRALLHAFDAATELLPGLRRGQTVLFRRRSA